MAGLAPLRIRIKRDSPSPDNISSRLHKTGLQSAATCDETKNTPIIKITAPQMHVLYNDDSDMHPQLLFKKKDKSSNTLALKHILLSSGQHDKW